MALSKGVLTKSLKNKPQRYQGQRATCCITCTSTRNPNQRRFSCFFLLVSRVHEGQRYRKRNVIRVTGHKDLHSNTTATFPFVPQ